MKSHISIDLKGIRISEQLRLEFWSVVWGSLVIDTLILYAGSVLWLLISGFIFGSMSRRGWKDFAICGLVAATSSVLVESVFKLKELSIQYVPLNLLAGAQPDLRIVALLVLSFLMGGAGGLAGSSAVVYYLRRFQKKEARLSGSD